MLMDTDGCGHVDSILDVLGGRYYTVATSSGNLSNHCIAFWDMVFRANCIIRSAIFLPRPGVSSLLAKVRIFYVSTKI